jgi:hypothetical protein
MPEWQFLGVSWGIHWFGKGTRKTSVSGSVGDTLGIRWGYVGDTLGGVVFGVWKPVFSGFFEFLGILPKNTRKSFPFGNGPGNPGNLKKP